MNESLHAEALFWRKTKTAPQNWSSALMKGEDLGSVFVVTAQFLLDGEILSSVALTDNHGTPVEPGPKNAPFRQRDAVQKSIKEIHYMVVKPSVRHPHMIFYPEPKSASGLNAIWTILLFHLP